MKMKYLDTLLTVKLLLTYAIFTLACATINALKGDYIDMEKNLRLMFY